MAQRPNFRLDESPYKAADRCRVDSWWRNSRKVSLIEPLSPRLAEGNIGFIDP
jgi:hypothetical protein